MRKLNDMCKNCIAFHAEGCIGEHNPVYTGCIYKFSPDMEMQHDERKYNLALMIPGFLYYADETESDENANTLIWRLSDNEIISNNYFAFNSMMEDLEKIHNGKIENYFMPRWFKELYDQNEKAGYFDE